MDRIHALLPQTYNGEKSSGRSCGKLDRGNKSIIRTFVEIEQLVKLSKDNNDILMIRMLLKFYFMTTNVN